MPSYTCQQCGDVFTRESQGQGRPAKFCSLDCSAASRKVLHRGICQQCGETFERKRSNYHAAPKFCSRRCNAKFNAATRPDIILKAVAASAARERTVKHGIYRYNKMGCRCDICKAAAKVYNDRNRKPVPPRHGVRRYRKFGCRCDVCVAAEARSYKKMQAIWARSNQRLTNETAEVAHRRGYQWTGPELEIVARKDLTAIQAAQMLGRTAHAVKHKRRALKVDPRMINLAGVVPDAGNLR